MPIGYREAFGLTDNPFGPKRRIGTVIPALTQMLERRPLLIHRARPLGELFCPDAGPFGKRSQELELELSTAEYRCDPASRGIKSYVFLVVGDRGTGKSTLASHMIEYIMRCTSAEGRPWQLFEALLNSDRETPGDQITALAGIEAKVGAETTAEDYCCVFIDDMLAGAFPHGLKLFDDLTKTVVTFFVVTSGDPALMAQAREKMRHTVTVFEVGELSPDAAVAFVRHRLGRYRAAVSPAVADFPLFPFDEADLRQAVDTGVIRGSAHHGPVTIRQLNVVLHDALQARLKVVAAVAPAVDVTTLSAAEAAQNLVQVAEAYRTLVLRP